MNTADTGKRYYWLKLPEDFFRQKEIKQLRKIAGGDTFTVVYLKMLLRSLKDNGRLYYDGIDENFVSELALDIDEDEDNVKVTVAFLLSKGILLQCEPDEYEITTAKAMTGSEGYSTERMRRLRGKKLLASHVTQSDACVTACDEEIEIEKEIEKRDRDREKRDRFTPPTIDEVQQYITERKYIVDAQKFVDYYESVGWKISGKAPMKNWKSTVNNWNRRELEKHPEKQKKVYGEMRADNIDDWW